MSKIDRDAWKRYGWKVDLHVTVVALLWIIALTSDVEWWPVTWVALVLCAVQAVYVILNPREGER